VKKTPWIADPYVDEFGRHPPSRRAAEGIERGARDVMKLGEIVSVGDRQVGRLRQVNMSYSMERCEMEMMVDTSDVAGMMRYPPEPQRPPSNAEWLDEQLAEVSE
jgi:hypothetical protein